MNNSSFSLPSFYTAATYKLGKINCHKNARFLNPKMAKSHDLPTRGLSPPPRFFRQDPELLTPKPGSAPELPFCSHENPVLL